MIRSFFTRLFFALALLGVISILAFCLSRLVPGDEVLDYLSIDDTRYSSSSDPLEHRSAYKRVASKRGLDLPLFYLSISPGYYPDSMYRILPKDDRNTLIKWIQISKNKANALRLHSDLKSGLSFSCLKSDTLPLAGAFCQNLGSMLTDPDFYSIHQSILSLKDLITKDGQMDPTFAPIVLSLNHDIEELIKSPKKLSGREWLPAAYWNGSRNQYHQWVSGFVTLKPLTSLLDGRDAWTKVLEALKWTLLMNGLAFILAIVLGIGIGVWSGMHDGHWLERIVNIKLFALFAVPSFWLATLFIFFLSSGEWLSIFPSGGLGPYHAAGNIFQKWGILFTHLTLPVLCLALGSLAYISRQMKQSVLNQLSQPYVLSLRAQGVSEKTILRRHIFRNALFPLITMIGGSLPALLSGSLIIEVIFSIPGIGRLMYSSIVARDWPVVFPILMMGATITVLSYILTDVFYKWADPRVKSMES